MTYPIVSLIYNNSLVVKEILLGNKANIKNNNHSFLLNSWLHTKACTKACMHTHTQTHNHSLTHTLHWSRNKAWKGPKNEKSQKIAYIYDRYRRFITLRQIWNISGSLHFTKVCLPPWKIQPNLLSYNKYQYVSWFCRLAGFLLREEVVFCVISSSSSSWLRL